MTNLNITTLIAQLPYLSNVAHAEAVHPEVQQAATAQMAQQALKDQNEQVQKIDAQDGSEPISDEDERRRGRGGQRRAQRRAAPPAQEEPVVVSNASPWVGLLVNTKV